LQARFRFLPNFAGRGFETAAEIMRFAKRRRKEKKETKPEFQGKGKE
jgi:hypothetical protein